MVSVPHDKLLIAFRNFNKVDELKTVILSKIFHVNVKSNEDQECIIKNLIWETKYYQVGYDLYIDSYESLEEWLDELLEEDFDMLRSVLSTIIIIDKYDDDKNVHLTMLLKRLAAHGDENLAHIFCNTSKTTTQERIDDINNQLVTSDGGPSIEFVNIFNETNQDTNEYGEKIGLPRIAEIIDTLEWIGCERDILKQGTSSILPVSDIQPESNLESIMTKLREAKLKYQNTKDNDDAESIAQEVANELLNSYNI